MFMSYLYHVIRIILEALSAELIPPPWKASRLENADRNKRCRYHKNSGHSTEECHALKDKIEELIQASTYGGSFRGAKAQDDPPKKTNLQSEGITLLRENEEMTADPSVSEEG